MALYENGKRISGIRDFPAYTWAEYHALPAAQRPKVWKCTDRDYAEIPDWFVTESMTVWPNLTLAANSSTSVQTKDISKSGYTPLGVVGYSFDGSYGNCLSYSKLTISGNTLTYLVANNGNTSATVNCVVAILYKKS